MPANLPPQYVEAEKNYRMAKGPLEKIAALVHKDFADSNTAVVFFQICYAWPYRAILYTGLEKSAAKRSYLA